MNTPAIVEPIHPAMVDVNLASTVSLQQVMDSYVFLYTENLRNLLAPLTNTGGSLKDYKLSRFRRSLIWHLNDYIPDWAKQTGYDFNLVPVFSHDEPHTGNCFSNAFLSTRVFDSYGRIYVPESIIFVKPSFALWLKENPLIELTQEFETYLEHEEIFEVPLPPNLQSKFKALVKEAQKAVKDKEQELETEYPLEEGRYYAELIDSLLRKPFKDTVSSYCTVQIMGGRRADDALVQEAISAFCGETDLQWFQQKLEERQAEKVELDKLLEEDKFL